MALAFARAENGDYTTAIRLTRDALTMKDADPDSRSHYLAALHCFLKKTSYTFHFNHRELQAAWLRLGRSLRPG